ncbi:MAG: MFS transporter [Cellulosilyticaceae bacterium]
MLTLLLVIIYIAFISLGLPDAILGAGWPLMHMELGVPISYAGIETMIVAGGTIVSSFFSGKAMRRFGTGKVTTISVFLTAIGLIGSCYAPNFVWICILGIPLGIGAGAVDAALNNFVALHYEAKHMNWLHCFWGVGATAGPLIMSFYLVKEHGWRMGYGTIGMMQAVLVVCLFASLPLWKKFESSQAEGEEKAEHIKVATLLRLPGAKPALLSFFCYCAVELTTGLWVSSYLVMSKGIRIERAAQWVSMYYFGITFGRFIAGFAAMKLSNTMMIRIGQVLAAVGAFALLIFNAPMLQLAGVMLIGMGCAPIYPAMLHETPMRFGKEYSQSIMGIQMATAYIGSTLMPPLFGAIAKVAGFSLLPYFVLTLIIVMFMASERVNRVMKAKH